MSEGQSTSIPPIVNKIMSALLRSPLHGIVSRSIMLITFTGSKTGQTYTTPISYARDGERVTAFSAARWTRNLAGGAPVTLRIKNREYRGWAEVTVEDKQVVAEDLRAFLRTVRSDARFYQVSYDPDGEPNWEQVQRAAQRTAVIHVQLEGPVAGDGKSY